MVQQYRDKSGKLHEFPDDATPEEIDSATKEYEMSTQDQNKPEMISTFLGKMKRPDKFNEMFSPEKVNEAINEGAGSLSGIGEIESGINLSKGLLPETISKAFKNTKEFMKKTSPKVVGKTIQNSHDALSDEASNIFNEVGSKAKKLGIDQVPIEKDLINQSKEYLPKTRSSNKMIKAAETGDYSSLRDLQSDLWKRGTKAKSSELISENNLGEEALDLRDKINEAISNHFKNSGHEDLSNLLDKGRDKYFKLKDTYYSHPTISKLVSKEMRKIPKNLISVLDEESVPMNKLKNENPYIKDILNRSKYISRALKGMTILGIGGGAYAGGKKLYDVLKD